MESPIPVVRVVITNEERKVLVLRRGKGASIGKWSFPGGKVDSGETLVQACKRETKEETGLTLEDVKFLFYQDNLPEKEDEKHYLVLCFEAHATGNLKLNEESSEAKWVKFNEAQEIDLAFRHEEIIKRLGDS